MRYMEVTPVDLVATLKNDFEETYKLFLRADDPLRSDLALPTLSKDFKWRNQMDPLYREQDVEKLLDEASDYLDRALKTRSEWQALYENSFRTYLEIATGLRTAEIIREEDKKGILELPILELQSQKEGIQARSTWAQGITNGLLNDTNIGTVAEYAADIAWRSAWRELPPDHYNHLTKSSGEQARSALEIQQAQLKGEVEEARARLGSSDASKPALSRAHEIITNLKELASARRELEIEGTYRKLQQAVIPGGAFCYPERLSHLAKRFMQDYLEAIPRMVKAAKGMNEFFGSNPIEHQLPAEENAQKSTFFDDCFQWARESTAKIVAVIRQDRLSTITISLRAVLGQQQWDQAVAAGSFPIDVTHKNLGIPESFLSSASGKLSPARLHGFVVETLDKSNTPLQARRAKATLRRSETFVGRILPVSNSKTLEPAGSTELWNIDPFDAWRLDFTSDSNLGSVDDIWLTLIIAFQR
jgi:hypothetical protein